MMVASGAVAADAAATTAMDTSASPTNASASSEPVSSGVATNVGAGGLLGGLSTADLSSLLAAATTQAALKQSLFKQDMSYAVHLPPAPPPHHHLLPFMGMAADPSVILALSQFLSAQQQNVAAATAQAQAAAAATATASAPSGGGPIRGASSSASSATALANQPQAASGHAERKRPYPCSFQFCVLCQKDVHSSKLPCHIRQCHVAKPMFQCPACDFTSTYSKNNVKSHMVSLHGLAGDPISYMDQYASQVEEFMKICFPNVRGRGRPMHGRHSPTSPSSPPNANAGRRASQGGTIAAAFRRPSMEPPSATQQLLAAAIQQHAARSHADAAAAHFYGLSPLVFSQQHAAALTVAAAQQQRSPICHNNNNNGDIKPTSMTSSTSAAAFQGSATQLLHCKLEPPESAASKEGSGHLERNSPHHGNSANAPPLHRLAHVMEPRYIEQTCSLSLLADDDLPGTVFASFASPVSALAEKIASPSVDGLLSPPCSSPRSLLSPAQSDAVAELRNDDGFRLFDVLYALHRLDPSIMSPSRLARIAAIAPSCVDARALAEQQQAQAAQEEHAALGDEEQLIIQLSTVERLQEKLAVLQHMTTYKANVEDIIQRLSLFTCAARALRASSDFSALVQLVLAVVNCLNGDREAALIRGYRVSDIAKLSDVRLKDGRPLLALLARCVRVACPMLETALFSFVELLAPLEHESFGVLVRRAHQLAEGNARAAREARAMAAASGAPVDFLAAAAAPLHFLQEQLAAGMELLSSVLDFFGEPRRSPADAFVPEAFFARLLAFCRALRSEFDAGSAPTAASSAPSTTTHHATATPPSRDASPTPNTVDVEQRDD